MPPGGALSSPGAARGTASRQDAASPVLLTMQATLLILIAMTPENVAQIAPHFHVIHAPTRAERDAAIARDGHHVLSLIHI